MAKISAYTDGVTPQNTDEFIAARAGANVELTWLAMKTAAGTPPTTTAANDFQVGDGAGAWIKKTLAETKTILGLAALAYLATINSSALIDNDIVTYAKMQNVSATNRIMGRATAGAGDMEEITVGGDLTQSGSSFSVVAASTTTAGKVELAIASEINTGTDTGRAMPVDQFVASNRNVRFMLVRIVDATTNCATGTTKGGDIELPFTGTITEIGAYVDTAGTTGTMVVDANLNGATIMTTNKLSIDSTEKSTRTAATPPTLTTTAVTAGDLLTFDIDSIHTTPAKGLTIRIGIRQS